MKVIRTLKTILQIKTKREYENEYLTYHLVGAGLDSGFRSPVPLDEIQQANHDLVSKSGGHAFLDQLAQMCFSSDLITQLGSVRAESPLQILCDSPVLCGIPWEALLACGQRSLLDCTLILAHRDCLRACKLFTLKDLPLRVVFIVNPSQNKLLENGSVALRNIVNSLQKEFSKFPQIKLKTDLDRFEHASVRDMQNAIYSSDVLVFYGNAVQNPDSYGFDVADNNELLVTKLVARKDGPSLRLPEIVFCLGSKTSGLAGQLAQIGIPYLFSNYRQEYYQPEVFKFVDLFLHELLDNLVSDRSFTIWDVNTAVEKKFLPGHSRDYFARMGYFENVLVERDDRIIQNLNDAIEHRNDDALLWLLKNVPDHSRLICLAISYLLHPLTQPFLKVEIILRFMELEISPELLGVEEAIRIFNNLVTQNMQGEKLLGEVLMDYLTGSELLNKIIRSRDLSPEASAFISSRIRSRPPAEQILEYLLMSMSHSPENQALIEEILTGFLYHHPEENTDLHLQTFAVNPLLPGAVIDFMRNIGIH